VLRRDRSNNLCRILNGIKMMITSEKAPGQVLDIPLCQIFLAIKQELTWLPVSKFLMHRSKILTQRSRFYWNLFHKLAVVSGPRFSTHMVCGPVNITSLGHISPGICVCS